MSEEVTQREALRVLTKLMIWVAVAGVFWITWGYLTHSDNPGLHSVADIDLRGLSPGDYMVVRWNQRKLYVWHRTKPMLAQLNGYEDQLSDPDSLHSQQPGAAKNYYRSVQPDYLVVFARNELQGCDVLAEPATLKNTAVSPWFGGFKATCQDVYFDLAGRVYRHHDQHPQDTPENLVVPPHQIIGERLIIMQE